MARKELDREKFRGWVEGIHRLASELDVKVTRVGVQYDQARMEWVYGAESDQNGCPPLG